MSKQDDYELKPGEPKKAETTVGAKPKPGEPGWVEPVPVIEKAEGTEGESGGPAPFEPEDVEKNKALAILGYFCFVIPLVAGPNSKYARFHANQGLLIFILWIVAVIGVVALHLGGMLAGWVFEKISVLSFFFGCIFNVLQPALLLGVLALMIMGIIHAANGERKGLPLIGHWTLIK